MVLLKYKKNTLFFCFLLPLELAGAAFALSARTVFQRLVCTVFTQISFWSHKLSERHSVGTNDAADARSTCLATPLRCTSKEAAGGDEVGPRPRCCYLLLPRSGSSRGVARGAGVLAQQKSGIFANHRPAFTSQRWITLLPIYAKKVLVAVPEFVLLTVQCFPLLFWVLSSKTSTACA